MMLPKQLTTVTFLSKSLAFVLFITLPIVMFFMGMKYQASIKDYSSRNTYVQIIPTREPTVSAVTASVTPTVVAKPTIWKIFKSKLGFSFEYPDTWGEPKEEIFDYTTANYGSGLQGKSYLLTFSSNKKITGGGKSRDFTAGRGSMISDYRGDPNKANGVYAYMDIIDPGCPSMGMTNTFQGLIYFNMPDKEISGVVLQFPVLSANDISLINKEFDISYQNDPCTENEAKANKLKGQQILKYIEEMGRLDEESRNNFDFFNRVKDTSRIITQ